MDNTVKQNLQSFISNLSNKDYAKADKDLKKVVEYKVQQRMAKAFKKDLF